MNNLKRVYFAAVGRELHIDVPLSNVALDYQPPELIAPRIAPVVDVPNITGQIPSFDRRDKMRIVDDKRAPGMASNIIDRDVSSDSFVVVNYALAEGVTLEDRQNADPIYVQRLFNGATEHVTGQLLLNWENRLATKAMNTSNVGSYSAVSSAWSDHDNSDPLSDLNTMLDNYEDANGMRPNKITFGNGAWRHFRRNTTVRNLIYGTNNGGGYVSRQQAAELLEVGEVMVGGAYKDTANEAQDESLSKVWGDNVLIYYAPDRPSVFEPSFMYSFRWSAPGVPNMQVERHPYDTRHKRELIEVGYYQDEKVTDSRYGWMLTAVTSST